MMPLVLGELQDELIRWGEAGLSARVWWRDDDAEYASEKLKSVISTANSLEIPIALATIPVNVARCLSDFLESIPKVSILQHGYSHKSHAPITEPKIEIGIHRPVSTTLSELMSGFSRLKEFFPTQFVPVLVPPWNRIHANLVPYLPHLGFEGLSAYRDTSAHGIEEFISLWNTHCDFIDWSARRSMRLEEMVRLILIQLQHRRLHHEHAIDPIGLLTHHLVHEPDFWDDFSALLSLLIAHPSSEVVSIDSLVKPIPPAHLNL